MGNMWQVRPCKVQCSPHRVATTMQGRAWRWLTKAAGELHRLYVSMKGEVEYAELNAGEHGLRRGCPVVSKVDLEEGRELCGI